MADFYVDSAATGTGSGTSPANASINIGSLAFGAVATHGDTLWVRRTFVVPQSGQTWSRSGFNVMSHAFIRVIGWPNTSDLHYDERPAAGISAGWDSDAGHFTGIPHPTIVISRASGGGNNVTGDGIYISNFAVVGSNAQDNLSFDAMFGGSNNANRRVGQVRLQRITPSGSIICDELVVVGSTSGIYFGGDVRVRKITFTSSCLFGQSPFDTVRNTRVNEINVATNSMQFFVRNNGSGIAEQRYGRVYGQRPVNSLAFDSQNFSGVGYTGIAVEDWYGEGPRRFSGTGGFEMSVCLSAAAVHSGSTGTFIGVRSVSTSNNNALWQLDETGGHAMQIVSVLSGQGYRVRWHVWMVGVASPALPIIDGMLHMAGIAGGRVVACNTFGGNFLAGTPSLWSGTSVAVGSAYQFTATFSPTNTGTCAIVGRVPVWASVRSGYVIVSPFFEVTS